MAPPRDIIRYNDTRRAYDILGLRHVDLIRRYGKLAFHRGSSSLQNIVVQGSLDRTTTRRTR